MFSAIIRVPGVSGMMLLITACQPESHSMTTQPVYTTISVRQLSQQLGTSPPIMIDARSPNAFNGWPLRNEQRGGHIPGAKLLSAEWITRNLPVLNTAYERTSIKPGKAVAVYGYDFRQSTVVADWLVNEQGHHPDDITLLEEGFSGWTGNVLNPVDRMPGYRSLVPALYLHEQIRNNPRLKVVEIGWDSGKDYSKGHIPGALYWNDLEFEHSPIYELNDVDVIRASLQRLGIGKDTPVAVYSTESIGAARGVSVMKYVGVTEAVMLNGGKDAWSAAGLPLEKKRVKPTPLQDFGVSGPGDTRVVIDIEQAQALRTRQDGALVSIRSWDEYIGEISGYAYFRKKGRITGALWGHAGDSAWNMDDYHNPDHTMRNYREIETFWNQWGIHPGTMTLAFYCGNGWRASEAWWYAQAMGYENSQIYSSGWMRWKNDPTNPVSEGDITRDESLQDWRIASGNDLSPEDTTSRRSDIITEL